MPWASGHYVPAHDFTQEYDAGQKKIRADLMDEQFSDLSDVFDETYGNSVKRTSTIEVNGSNIFIPRPLEPTYFGQTITLSGTEINISSGSCFYKVIGENTTFTFTNSAYGLCICFSLILRSGGSHSVIWPSNVLWTNGFVPEMSTDGIDVINFLTPDGGVTWYGVHCLNGAM